MVNELTNISPTSGTQISINVFVKAGKDFEVVDPTFDAMRKLTYVLPLTAEPVALQGDPLETITEERNPAVSYDGVFAQSEDLPSGDATQDDGVPVKETVDDAIMSTLPKDHTHSVFFGDPVTSFRTLSKRYNYHGFDPVPSTGFKYYTMNRWNFPTYRGYLTNGLYNSAEPVNPTPYNFYFSTLLNYITPAYICRRGSIRWKRLLNSRDPAILQGGMTVERIQDVNEETISSFSIFNDSNSRSIRAKQFNVRSSGIQSLQGNVPIHNPVLEYEMPWYTIFRFSPAKTISGPSTQDEYHSVNFAANTNTSRLTGWDSYVSAGEDFTLSLFTGCPILYLTTDPIAA